MLWLLAMETLETESPVPIPPTPAAPAAPPPPLPAGAVLAESPGGLTPPGPLGLGPTEPELLLEARLASLVDALAAKGMESVSLRSSGLALPT